MIATYSGAMEGGRQGLRLVADNGRTVPAAPPMTGWSAAGPRAEQFERTVVRPALESAKPELELHRVKIWGDEPSPEPFTGLPAYLDDSFRKSFGKSPATIPDAYPFAPDRPAVGVHLGAVTMETFRRAANPHHGVFLWTILYRLDEHEKLVAHPVVFYRMHYDGQWHRFDDRFRPGEDWTPIAEITPAMITAHVLEAFRIYEETADADGPPPPSDRRETRTPPAPVFRAR